MFEKMISITCIQCRGKFQFLFGTTYNFVALHKKLEHPRAICETADDLSAKL